MNDKNKEKILDDFNRFLIERTFYIDYSISSIINFIRNTKNAEFDLNDINAIEESIVKIINTSRNRACVPSYIHFNKCENNIMYDYKNDGVPCCFCIKEHKNSYCTYDNCLFWR